MFCRVKGECVAFGFKDNNYLIFETVHVNVVQLLSCENMTVFSTEMPMTDKHLMQRHIIYLVLLLFCRK